MSLLLELSEHLRVYHGAPTLMLEEAQGDYGLLAAVHDHDHAAERGNQRPMPMAIPHEHSLLAT